MDPTSDYTPVARWYDETRDMPAGLLTECFARFAVLVGFAPPRLVLDAGCGTAQLSVPLLAVGHEVVGVDVSAALLSRARTKVQPGGYLLHVNEKGAFKNAVRTRFAQECDARGHVDRYHGLRDRTQLAVYIRDSGGTPVTLDDPVPHR